MAILDAPPYITKTAAMLNQRDVGKRIWVFGGWFYIQLIYHGIKTSVRVTANEYGRGSTWRLDPNTEVMVEKRQ